MTDDRIFEIFAASIDTPLDFARAIEREVREECAKVIDDHVEMTNLRTGERSLVPREKRNLSAIAYADAIRKGGEG